MALAESPFEAAATVVPAAFAPAAFEVAATVVVAAASAAAASEAAAVEAVANFVDSSAVAACSFAVVAYSSGVAEYSFAAFAVVVSSLLLVPAPAPVKVAAELMPDQAYSGLALQGSEPLQEEHLHSKRLQ